MTVVAVVVVVAVVALWVMSVVRRGGRASSTLAASRALLDTELDRRYEQTQTLVLAARAAGMNSSLVTPLAGARSFAVAVRDQDLTLAERAGAENALSVALHGVVTEAAADATVKNDWAVQQPVHELRTTEQRLAGAARVYNDHAAAVNALRRRLPGAPVARLCGVRPAPLFEAAPATRAEEDVELAAT